MSVNLTSEQAKNREWAIQLRLRSPMEIRLFNQLIAEFRRLAAEVASLVRLGGGVLSGAAIDSGHITRMKLILGTSWRQAMDVFGDRTATLMVGADVLQTPAYQRSFDQLARAWIQGDGGLKIVEISNHTRNQINDIVRAAFNEGLSVDKTAFRILTETSIKTRNRAAVIARTEIHAASNFGALASADTLNIPVQKEWISGQDPRTRETHVNANGQLRAKNAAFNVGASELQYPGDQAGQAKETIQCRCALGWKTNLADLAA